MFLSICEIFCFAVQLQVKVCVELFVFGFGLCFGLLFGCGGCNKQMAQAT
jgi:hypothetical protein